MAIKKEIAGIMFLDLRGYSKLTEPQLRRFFEKVLPCIADILNKPEFFYKNSWGDAVVVASKDILKLTDAAMTIRGLFPNTNWIELEMPPLAPRISLHSGPIYLGTDPIKGADGIVGTQVNLAARVEPVALPGHVWATDNFVSILQLEAQNTFSWDDLGERQLAKEWGAKRLFRVRRAHESPDLPSLADAEVVEKADSLVGKIDLCRRLLNLGTMEQKLSALDMLGKVSSSESLSLLLTYAKKKEEALNVRLMALASIAEAKSQAVVPDLLDMLSDPNEPEIVIGSVIEALGKLPDQRSFKLLAAIAEVGEESLYNPRLREVALQSLSRLKDSRAVPILRRVLQSGAGEMIDSAIGAAGLLRNKALSETLIDVACAKDHFDAGLRGATIEAIILAGTGPMASIFDKVAALATDISESPRVRQPAIDLLAMFENSDSRRILSEIAGRLDDEMSGRALKGVFLGEQLGRARIEEFEKHTGT